MKSAWPAGVAGWRARLIEAAGRRRSATEALAAAP
jgi:hypothetical protein